MAEKSFVSLKLSRTDARLIQQVLTALVTTPEACHRVLSTASQGRSYPAEQVGALVRISNYIQTVGMAE